MSLDKRFNGHGILKSKPRSHGVNQIFITFFFDIFSISSVCFLAPYNFHILQLFSSFRHLCLYLTFSTISTFSGVLLFPAKISTYFFLQCVMSSLSSFFLDFLFFHLVLSLFQLLQLIYKYFSREFSPPSEKVILLRVTVFHFSIQLQKVSSRSQRKSFWLHLCEYFEIKHINTPREFGL